MTQLRYPDFIAFLGQENTPPGAGRTIEGWRELAGIGDDSHILDLACSTGYSSRMLSTIAGSSAEGIDVSAPAIAMARLEAKDAGLADRVCYSVADATVLPFQDAHFSHVVAGCCFGFIEGREEALRECRRVLIPGGCLCIASFYYESAPPETLLDRVASVIGYRPDARRDLRYWERFFRREFELRGEQRYELPPQPEAAIEEAVREFIYGRSGRLGGQSQAVKKACFDRLLHTRLVLNAHRCYQGLNVSVWVRA